MYVQNIYSCSQNFILNRINMFQVTIHAIGPMAHLVQNVHEQSYVTHMISYAARIGRYQGQ